MVEAVVVLRSIKQVLETYGDFMVKSNLSLRTGFAALRHVSPIVKKRP